MLVCDHCHRTNKETDMVKQFSVTIGSADARHLAADLGIDYQLTVELCCDCREKLAAWIGNAIADLTGKAWSESL